MTKLFLTSNYILPHQHEHLEKLVGKPLSETTCGVIENAADPYDPTEEDYFVFKNRNAIIETGMLITLVDLREYKGDFSEFDVIWFGGGNTFYLRWLVEEKGFADKIKKHIEADKVYVGSSAGSLLIGPSIEDADTMDDPGDAPVRINVGLGIMKEILLPHANHPDYKETVDQAGNAMRAKGFEVIELEDGQIYIRNLDKEKII